MDYRISLFFIDNNVINILNSYRSFSAAEKVEFLFVFVHERKKYQPIKESVLSGII